jgi:hypothetical protein
MLHSNERIIKHKVGLLNLAEELGNVSKACQIAKNRVRDLFFGRTRWVKRKWVSDPVFSSKLEHWKCPRL